MPYKKGDSIGQKYEVFDVLGEGGFGIVYLVYSLEAKRAYALKTFRDEYFNDITTRERFKKEAQVWIDLERHPYLVRAYFVDEISGRLYIAMEHITVHEPGMNTLEGHLRRRRTDLAQSLKWAIQFCHGMEYAYSKGIRAHRDIKPANIMIDQNNVVKISDFGLAGIIHSNTVYEQGITSEKAKSNLSMQTIIGTSIGTPEYMSPEQFTDFSACDERSDIYSFGIVLYQMASGGSLPFSSDSPQYRWAALKHLHIEVPVPKLNSSLFMIIWRCLQKKPLMRYWSFKDLRYELEIILKETTGEVIKLPESKELEVWEWLNKGVSLGSLGKFQESIACYDKIIELDPSDAKAWNNKGTILDKLGKYQESIACYDKAIEIDPKLNEVWYNKGIILGNLEKQHESIVCFDKAIEIDPSDARSWNNKGIVFNKLGKYQESIACYDKAIEIDPRYTKAWRDKAIALAELGKDQEAINCYDKVIEITPIDAGAWYNKGVALGNLGKEKEAIICYDKACEINPNNTKAWCDKAIVLGSLGREEEAIPCYDRALELNPRDTEAWYNKGVALGNLGKLKDAIPCFDRALKLNPKLVPAWFGKALAEDELNEKDMAINSYIHFLQCAPAHDVGPIARARKRLEDLWYNKGKAFANMGKHQEAILCYEKTLELNPRDDDAWDSKGFSLLNLGKFQEAVVCYDKSLDINPDKSGWYNKGIALGKLDKLKEAIPCFDRALELNPQNTDAWMCKGLAEEKLDRTQEAIISYKQFLKLASADNSNIAPISKRIEELDGKQELL